MVNQIIKEKHQALCTSIQSANHDYYVRDISLVTDQQYDLWFSDLRQLEVKYPELVSSSSPTQRVGELVRAGFTKVAHTTAMLSLDNTYTQKDLQDFDKRVLKSIPYFPEYICEPKFDGVSIEVVYKNGSLFQAITRGDGKVGEDVTCNIRTIKSIPLQISYKEDLTVRGEVVIYRKDLDKVNEQRVLNGEEPFANPRNAASGSLRLLDSKEVAKRPLRAFFYQVVSTVENCSTQDKVLSFMSSLNLPVYDKYKVCVEIEGVEDFIKSFETNRKELPYDTDGVVVKVNCVEYQQELGFTSRAPKWAMAYKYQAERALTKVLDIICDVGRTGVLTPVAVLEPVQLSGSVVARASLHNADYVSDKDIRIGDTVRIEKAAEIIPQVVDVVLGSRQTNSKSWTFPIMCPVCDAPVVQMEEEAASRCSNPKCDGRLKAAVLYMVSRKCLNIDGIGESFIDQLVEKKIVEDIADLFSLDSKRAQLLNELDRMGEKSVNKILAGVKESKTTRTLAMFLTSLGISLVGRTVSTKIADKLESIKDLVKIGSGDLIVKELEIGNKAEENFYKWMKSEYGQRIINKCIQFGTSPLVAQKRSIVMSNGKLSGSSFCITGTLSSPREVIQSKIRSSGGEVHDSTKKTTTYLIAGDKVGKAKLDKAAKFGTKVISEEDLNGMIG